MVNIRGIFLVALMLSGVMPLSATTLNQFLSSGYPKAGMGVPYGYNSSSMGAGDQSFQWCLDLVSTNMVKPSVTAPAARRRPLVIICGKDSCGTCSAFADMVNKNPRGMPTWFGRLKITTAYFRGTKPACEKARAFIKGHQVGGGGNKVGFKESESVDPCHRVYVYGVYENGDRYFGTIGSIPMTPDTYGTAIAAQIKRFDNDYDNHLYKPPAANAEFTVEDGWLEATPETEQVYVPFSRTNDITRVETNRLVATFPDNTAVTNDVAWTENSTTSTNVEVAVKMPVEMPKKWVEKKERIRLELLSTNGVSVATNFITCVAATESFLLPSLDTNRLESAEMNPWGVWTLLEGDAKAVAAANGHIVTNGVPRYVDAGSTNFTYTITNLVTTVFTNALDLFLTPEEQQFDADVRACQTNVYSVLAASTQKASYMRVVITNYVDEAALAAFGEAAVTDGCAVSNFPLTVTATFTDAWRAVDLAGAPLAEEVLGTVEGEQIVNDGTNIVWCLTNETCSVVGKATTNVVAGVATDVSHEIESRVYRLNVDDTTKTTSPVTQTVPFIQDCVTFTNYVDEVGLAAFGEAAVAEGCAVSNDTVTVTATFTNRWFLVDGVTTNEFPALTPFNVAESVIVTNRIWILTNATDQAVGGVETNTEQRLSWNISADVTNFWYSVAAGTALQTNTVVCTQELITRYTEDAGQVGTGTEGADRPIEVPFENVWTVLPSKELGHVGGVRTNAFTITDIQAGNLAWSAQEQTGTVTNSVASFVETYLTNAVHQAGTETVITNFATFKVVARVVTRTCEAKAANQQPAPSLITITNNWTDEAFTETDLEGFDKRVRWPTNDVPRKATWPAESTNTVYWVLADDCKAAQTNDFDTVVWTSPGYERKNRFYRITRDQYTGGDIKAFQLRVTGGLVWDARVRALADTFDSKEFKDWCAVSKVVCTVIDQRNAATGASLFTHVQATNGMRGTRFLSRNGLSEKENGARSSEGDTFKVELIRPDGTTEDGEKVYENGVQKATGQIVWSTTDPARFDTVAKARATLNGALELAKADPTENLNDDPATTPLTLAFNTTVTNQTLSALDAVDVFRLTGAYWDKAVAFTLTNTNKTDTADVLSFSVCDEAGMEIPPTFDAAESTNRVWVFKADDAVFVKVFTTNALPGMVAYGVGATNAPPCPGTVGFKVTEAAVEEGVVTNVADNAFAFLRTEGTINYFGLAVRRTGYTGAASCTISLDEDAIPEDMREDVRKRIVWENQKLTWNGLECGETNVVIGLVNDKDWYADVKLTFNLEVVSGDGVEVREGDGSFTLTYKDNDPMDPGKLAIDKENMTGDAFRAAGDGKFYARAGTSLDIPVNRNDASCSNVTGRLVVVTSGVGIKITDPDSGEDISETGLVWEDRESDPKTFSVGLPKEVKPGSKGHQEIKLELKGDHVDSKSNSVTICVLPANAPGWNDTSPDGECSPDEKTTWTGVQYTKFEDSVELAGDGDLVSHKLISGAVPAGLKATLDKAGRRLVVAGTPTVATPTNGVTLVYQAQATVGGKTVWTLPVTLHITIKALADVNANFAGDGAKAKTVWTGLVLLDKTAVDAGEPARLRGLLDLTVSPKGRTSAKWRTVEGKTVSFSAAGFAGIDEASGDVGLAATRVVAGVTNTLTATLFAAGKIKMEATIASNDVKVAFGTVEADAAAWSKDHPATDYVGTYVAAFPVDTNWVETVAGGTSPLCSGAATLTFRLAAGAARTGRTTFAGVLPNGRTFSGSATLAGNAALPVLAASATDAFAAELDIAKEGEVVATDRTEPFWAHRERNFASLSYDPALISVGARWTAPDKGKVAELPLDIEAQGAGGEVSATRLRLNRTSGAVQGALRARDAETGRLATRTARGVLVPRGEEGFALFGARWWNEVLDAERDDGKTVRKTVRVGKSLGE